MAGVTSNLLLSSSKASDSRLSVQLHPLAILTISDYTTRHVLRQQTGPIVGAIMGAQNGRNISMENAFECKTEANKDGEAQLDSGWFHDRLQQYKDVHKAPPLDFVAWFTLTPASGPESHHLAIHNQILRDYNESALLLAFHPSSVAQGASNGGKLPFTVYESVYEAGTDDGDRMMQAAGEGPSLVLRFKELSYSIETGDAEMIGVDFVARGGANAEAQASTLATNKGKGTGKSPSDDSNGANTPALVNSLSPEEEEIVASLTAKSNAISMLLQRLRLIRSYLTSLPPCYLNDDSIQKCEPNEQISYTILRSVASMLARLSVVKPSTPFRIGSDSMLKYNIESDQEAADVALVALLGNLGSTLQSAQAMGKKSGVVESSRSSKSKASLSNTYGPPGGDYGDLPFSDEGYGHEELGDMPEGLHA